MNKKVWIMATLVIMIAAPQLLTAQSETILINNKSVFKKENRPAVSFAHINHMDLEDVSCTDCHHRYENGENVLDPDELTEENISTIVCSSCHKKKSELEKAYHHRCIGCHDNLKKGKTAGPRMCGECHKKNQ